MICDMEMWADVNQKIQVILYVWWMVNWILNLCEDFSMSFDGLLGIQKWLLQVKVLNFYFKLLFKAIKSYQLLIKLINYYF